MIPIIICDSKFLINSSGINTFVKNLCKLFYINKIEYYLYTDYNTKISDIYTKNISIKQTKNIFDTLSKLNVNTKYFFIANSLDSLIILDKLSHIYKESKFMYYTHIGDIIHDDFNSYDFSIEDKNLTINIINNNNNISIGTQSYNLYNLLNKKYTNKIYTLFEPLYIENNINNIKKYKIYDIISIMSNTKRKRIDKIIKLTSKNNFNTLLATYSYYGYYDIRNLCIQNKTNINVVENIFNDYIPEYCMYSDIMLHSSNIEVFPYAILECASYIPVIIDINGLWSNLFPDEYVYKCNFDNNDELLNTIKIAKNNKLKFDLNKYMNLCEKQWLEVIN